MTNQSKAPKLVLAPLSLDTVAQAGKDTAKAIAACEGAKARLLTELVGVANRLGTPLSAAQYDRQFAPSYRDALAAQVKRGKLTEKSAGSYGSKVKTAFLAMLSGFKPVAGETFWAFYDRAAAAMSGLTLPDGSPVWATEGKAGRKAGSKSKVKVTADAGLRQFTDAMAKANDHHDAESGFDRRPQMAAALILAHGNEARAQRLCIVAESYAEDFDKWTATILTDADKAELAKRTAPTTEPAMAPTPKAPTPKAPRKGRLDADFGPVGAALIAAQAKASAKAGTAPSA